MVDPNNFITYAQNREDLILAAFFPDIQEGFYVDAGAHHPKIDSVTQYFYERGWRGINIEPIEKFHKLFVKQRPKDINLNCGVAAKEGVLTLREYKNMEGRSTFSDTEKTDYPPSNEFRDYQVKVRSLEDIFNELKPSIIHFLKVDVEGFEFEVLKGNNWELYRPQVICIEANHVSENWRPFLARNNYREVFFDGLNEYYIAREALSRLGNFSFPKNVVEKSYFALRYHHYKEWEKDNKELLELEKTCNEQKEVKESIQRQLDQQAQVLQKLEALSLKDKSFRARLKIVLVGLTKDWINFKRQP